MEKHCNYRFFCYNDLVRMHGETYRDEKLSHRAKTQYFEMTKEQYFENE